MSTKQPMEDGLAANQFHFDLTPCGEPVINSTSEMPGPPHEIKLDEHHRILGASPSGNGHILYVALTIGLLATFGLAWMVLNGAALPFDLPVATSMRIRSIVTRCEGSAPPDPPGRALVRSALLARALRAYKHCLPPGRAAGPREHRPSAAASTPAPYPQ